MHTLMDTLYVTLQYPQSALSLSLYPHLYIYSVYIGSVKGDMLPTLDASQSSLTHPAVGIGSALDPTGTDCD